MKSATLSTLRSLLVLVIVLIPPCLANAANKIIAVVNDEVITQNQLNQVIHSLNQQNRAEGKSMSPGDIRKEALNQLIGDKLQLHIAKQNGVSATDQEVNQSLKNIAAQHRMTIDQLKGALSKEGIHYPAYRDFVKNRIILEKLQAQFIYPKVKVTEGDIAAAMTQTKDIHAPAHLVDILIAPESEKEITQAKTVAQKIRQQLLSGKNIQTALKAVPHPKVNINQQDLGWKALPELPDLFANAIRDLGKGQVSQIVIAPNGIHLLKVIDRKGQSISKAEAKKIAFFKKLQLEIKKWVEELKKQAYVEIK